MFFFWRESQGPSYLYSTIRSRAHTAVRWQIDLTTKFSHKVLHLPYLGSSRRTKHITSRAFAEIRETNPLFFLQQSRKMPIPMEPRSTPWLAVSRLAVEPIISKRQDCPWLDGLIIATTAVRDTCDVFAFPCAALAANLVLQILHAIQVRSSTTV